MRKLVIFILMFLFAVSAFGCAAQYGRRGQEMAFLEPSTVFKFSDLPVPSGFYLLPDDSYTFQSTGMRVGVLKYQGKANPDQIINFYKEQMPIHDWNLLNVVEFGDRLMNFEREDETCIIGLLTRGNNITITISLGPKANKIQEVKVKQDKPVVVQRPARTPIK